MKKVGVIGSAVVGQTLARGFKAHGYEVRIASRTPAKLSEFSAGAGIAAGPFAEVAAWADAVVLAVHGGAAEAAVRTAGADNLAGKVIIDTTNPIADGPPVDGVIPYFTGPNDSLLERLQRAVPAGDSSRRSTASAARAWSIPRSREAIRRCSIAATTRRRRRGSPSVVKQFGWEPADMGTAVAARAIEPLAQLWCIPGFLRNQWTHAFKVLWE